MRSEAKFIETLTTLIDERVELALDSHNAQAIDRNGWLSTKEAAQYLACPISRVYDLVSPGRLQPSRDGVRLKFTTNQLDAYLEKA